MTEVDLQKEIRKIIVQELIPDMKIFETNTFKGFLQDIPLDLGYGDETEIVDKSHAPHGACELKCMPCGPLIVPLYVTLPTERVS